MPHWLLILPVAIAFSLIVNPAESQASPFKIYRKHIPYPATIRALAEKWSRIFGIPVSWIVSQAYAESRNNPLAVNPSGATGVLQIKLVRALDLFKWIKKSEFIKNPLVCETLRKFKGQVQDLYDPDLNVMLATFDLWHLRRKFGNNHDLVSAAYNQGEGRIGRALASGSPFPPRAIEYVARVASAKKLGYL